MPTSEWIPVVCKEASSEYYRSVEATFFSNWSVPIGMQSVECAVSIYVGEKGETENVRFDRCPSDKALRDSVRKAISDSGPIPLMDIEACRRFPLEIVFRAE